MVVEAIRSNRRKTGLAWQSQELPIFCVDVSKEHHAVQIAGVCYMPLNNGRLTRLGATKPLLYTSGRTHVCDCHYLLKMMRFSLFPRVGRRQLFMV